MGTDKALLDVAGSTMVERVVAACREAGAAPVAVVGHRRPSALPPGLGAVPITDLHPGEGPLGGLLTALRWSPAPITLVLGCDLPFVTGTLLDRLVAALGDDDRADAALARSGRGAEPLVGAWRRAAASALAARFEAGVRAVVDALDGLRVVTVDADDRAVANVNDPGDLDEARVATVGDPIRAKLAGQPAPRRRRLTDSEVPQIDVHTLHDLLPSGIALVDVREADEWLVARVPGVPLVPMSELAERVDDVPSTGRVYLICASGARSHRVAEFLRARGVDAVNVAGGTNGWVEAGYEVESGPSSA